MAYTINPNSEPVGPTYGIPTQPGSNPGVTTPVNPGIPTQPTQPTPTNPGNQIVGSGLNMTNATNARSTTGIKALAANYEDDIKKVLTAIHGSQYTELKKIIRTYWQGADCDYFIQQLDKTTNDLKTQIAGYTSQMTNALNQEDSNFRKFQASNKV